MIAETIYIMPPSAGGGARAATEVTEKFALDSSDASADKANNNNHNRGGSFFKRNFSHLSNQGPKFISLLYTHICRNYGHPIKPFFIEIPNVWVWADNFGR